MIALDPEVPQGGTIRETIGWQADVPDHGVVEHTFWLISLYGTGATVEDFTSELPPGALQITTTSMSRNDDIDSFIPTTTPIGTYSCLTMIAENYSYDPTTGYFDIDGIYDSKLDVNVLTVITPLGATIISTEFTKI